MSKRKSKTHFTHKDNINKYKIIKVEKYNSPESP